ncbi:vWA domain-containing protein [Singulisphaera acidiphila]|uniref:VWFA domain-containing protein n=1 Tax=Singulisphaera acidiphila (strain ATCC BAA-1392 / DSM 18658 / VKM B-2454 / MOB10) TaxID=886293 RepID=L0D776_SINAD|nr:vWA domain-containing protein [Singulisphaera acidiphila]AGA24471.1 hypothetical protein Sinac_0007 [Singulisphaera acidiphila DSM 18658]
MRTVGIRAAVREQMVTRARRKPSESSEPIGLDAEVVSEEAGFRAFLRGLDRRYPQVSRWLGGRLDIEVPAILVSVGVHAVLMLGLGMAGLAVQHEVQREFQSRVEDHTVLGELDAKADFQDLDMEDKPLTNTAVGGSFSPNLAPTVVSAPPGVSVDPMDAASAKPASTLQLASLDVSQATRVAVPTATMLGQTVSIKGNGAEYADGVDGAVDRIAQEILGRLEKGRTLVIWAFDASGSLAVEREKLGKQIDTIYGHIAELDGEDLSHDGGLLTSVVAFGNDRSAMTTAPTADKAEIVSAINAVPLDTTGIETTFGTVAEIVRRWGHYKDAKGNPYRAMIIVVTDEVGDDEPRLEEAIDVASRAKVPVYVLGSQALFGRAMGAMDYFDPKTKVHHRNLPVRQGPESVALEQIKLPFWYDGYQYDMLDSGFGPYALSRLAGATGGIFFVTRMGPARMGFDPVMMREYKPDLLSRQQYEATVAKHPIRQAVLEAAMITQQRMGPQPSLTFPAADGPEFKEVMADNQTKAALTANAVDEALGPIMQAAKHRDRETSRRWQAHYDLIRGRLLAMKIRCYEYNWACATMKKDALKFKNETSNAWKLVPSEEIRYSDKAASAAKQAKDLLQRVIDEHPNTPWALLAKRELKDAFGFQWVETYVKPIERPKMDSPAAKKQKEAMKTMAKPVEVPKL